MSDVLTGDELSEKLRPLLRLPPSEQAELIGSLCGGRQECEAQLKQIVKLAKINQKVAEQIFAQELNALYARAPAKPIHELDSTSFELRRKLEDSTFEIAACRNTISKLPISSFITGNFLGLPVESLTSQDYLKVLMYYPHYTEYTYVTGCRNKGAWTCDNKNMIPEIRDAIKKSLSMGVDPYTFLAIGLMEGGSGGWKGLYLDPIGKMKGMGCAESKGDTTKPGKGKLASYGNFHKIEPGTIQNEELSGDLKRFLESKKETTLGTSYLCRNLENARAKILQTADPSQCCLKLGFTPKDNSTEHIEEALTVKFVGQTQFRQMAGKTDPAFRIQGFNGFSKLMGGAEGVSTFRAGVNYYETPTYGYQGMDFILNSLIANPWLKKEIEKQSKELGVNSPSILCMDVAVPGTYQIDSDYYFKKHRDAPRLKSLSGRTWASMTPREKKVLKQELTEPGIQGAILKKFGATPAEIHREGTGLSVHTMKGSDGSVYKQTNNKDTGAETFEKIEPKAGKKTSYSNSKDFVDAAKSVFNPEKAKKGFTVVFGDQKRKFQFSGGMDPKLFLTSKIFEGRYWGSMPSPPYKITYTNGTICQMDKDGHQSCKDKAGKPPESLPPSGNEKIEWPDGKALTITTTGNPEQVNEQKLIYADGTTVTQTLQSIDAPSKNGANQSVKIEDVVPYYFKEIYPTRSTVAKASPLPWTDLPDDALQEIIKRVNP